MTFRTEDVFNEITVRKYFDYSCAFILIFDRSYYLPILFNDKIRNTFCADTVEHTRDLVFLTKKAWKDTTCVFPFTYKGQQQHGCIGDKPWCATTYNFDSDKAWKYCNNSDCKFDLYFICDFKG